MRTIVLFSILHIIFTGCEFIFPRSKQITTSRNFVGYEEKSTGYKFKRVYDENAGCFISKTIQTTFQFIPITKTLSALFVDPVFEDVYMNFNGSKSHDCIDGVYHNFCCGKVYRSSPFFASNPSAVQIRLFTDDFEPCDPLKSKAGVHKMTAFYFQINNLPSNLLSKTDNIYLVALSDASDSKNELADIENVIETVVADLKILASKGIPTGKKNILKGALVCCSFDNLGGNMLFGFSGGFNANFYCRMCTSKRQECQTMVRENPATLRTKNEYDAIISLLQSDAPPNLTRSKGIKSPCILNTLDNFHILSNISVDLMHDVFEGTVGFLLEQVFNYLVRNKIASIDELQNLVHCFQYGRLSSNNTPSKIILEKKNVGQNASQARCLMMHLPFILFKYKSQLESVWLVVETKLQIIQILMSDEINETDLDRLTNLITTHLNCSQAIFGQMLKPKHHFLLHYPSVIRAMGPVIHFWAMRMEAKHQYFKRIAYRTKNFVNIKKTLAEKHQEKFQSNSFVSDEVIYGKEVALIEQNDSEKYFEELKSMNFSNDSIAQSSTLKSLKINNYRYKPNFLIANATNFFEIQYILSVENQIFFLSNKIYEVQGYDSFLNAMKITSEDKLSILNLNEMKNKKSYEKKNVLGDV